MERQIIIPYLLNLTAVCTVCEVPFHYDCSLSKRAPRVCNLCKTRGNARREAARRARLKAGVLLHDTELQGLAIRSYREVAAVLDISPEAVRLLEQSALAKLRAVITKRNNEVV